MTYEEALQIAMEELDEKIKVLSDTFQGHSARIETYIYDLAMARKALMQASEEKREWVYLTEEEMLHIVTRDGMQLAEAIEAKLKQKNT